MVFSRYAIFFLYMSFWMESYMRSAICFCYWAVLLPAMLREVKGAFYDGVVVG